MRPLFAACCVPALLLAACGDSSPPAKPTAESKPATESKAPAAKAAAKSSIDPDDLRFKPTVRLKAAGRYEGPAVLAYKQSEGSGDVVDTLTLEFTVDLDKAQLVGPVTFANGTTEVKRIYNTFKQCTPPVLVGKFEFFTAEKASILNEQVLEIEGTQNHAEMKVNRLCPGSLELSPIAAKAVPHKIMFPLIDPRAIRMGYMQDTTMGADGKSYSMFLQDAYKKPLDHWRWEVSFEIVSMPSG